MRRREPQPGPCACCHAVGAALRASISQQKRAQGERNESSEIFRYSPQPVCVLGATDGVIALITAATVAVLGRACALASKAVIGVDRARCSILSASLGGMKMSKECQQSCVNLKERSSTEQRSFAPSAFDTPHSVTSTHGLPLLPSYLC